MKTIGKYKIISDKNSMWVLQDTKGNQFNCLIDPQNTEEEKLEWIRHTARFNRRNKKRIERLKREFNLK